MLCPHPRSPSRTAPLPQSQRSPLKPKMDEGDDMAAVINDGLELYARQLQQVGAAAGDSTASHAQLASMRRRQAHASAGAGLDASQMSS